MTRTSCGVQLFQNSRTQRAGGPHSQGRAQGLKESLVEKVVAGPLGDSVG